MQSQSENDDYSGWIKENREKILTGSLVLFGLVGLLWQTSKNQKPTKQELEKMKNDILNGLLYPQ